MNIISPIRRWWQQFSGEEETPFDGDAPVWLVSLVVHLALMVGLALTVIRFQEPQHSLTVLTPMEDVQEEEIEVAQQFMFDPNPQVEIGANSHAGTEAALSLAPIVADVSEIPIPKEITTEDRAQYLVNNAVAEATGLHYNKNMRVKGAAGVSATGAVGAIDRITQEILLSLEERKTLVVWLFDQSGSLAQQRQSILKRFDRIYQELGVIEASGNASFAKHVVDGKQANKDKPLLTSVVSFGKTFQLLTPQPTDDVGHIKALVSAIPLDESGDEMVFSAIYAAAKKYRPLRKTDPQTGEPARNVMMVVFTDERGNDYNGLEETVKICRNFQMPVYVVGVPAPFGRVETRLKWVDPDPRYDQAPQWGVVTQGPESFMPERINLSFSGNQRNEAPLDSGFGPFALTRLCVETGGLYFTVHPNRNVNRRVGRGEVSSFSAHLTHFFDPEVMRRYQPDYVSSQEYSRRVRENRARAALVDAATKSWVGQMVSPRVRFVNRDQARFVNDLSEAQKQAAKLEPKIRYLYERLKIGEVDRAKETTPRWQAGFDLAYGRVLAVKVRTEGYNAMLAQAKRGMKFKNPKNNTWVLQPVNEISVGSKMAKEAEKARKLLGGVVKDHPKTPWALLARRELNNPVGWKWQETFTDLSPRPRRRNAAGRPRPARDDQRRMLKKPPPRRKPPKL